ncbi:RNA polymerase sigma factor [Proteiniclasticum ruminis]|uniref:RNA polymerase sigma-70 factor, ECF subfamily n=1 Tax=Proteiniclasticum ruminis TaxID=398199 RepID=A0A1I4YWJ8_9CLOT|nr:RNA polymerase sigma factor [Proteiniclasticum ruminis]SFN42436.1 RNA polymerase sigma-70 factor, ECF subfamily [Proteiniclasticum ruminis]
MLQTMLRSRENFEEIYETNVDMVYRICFTYLKNTADTEDMVQNTFIKLMEQSDSFQSKEHVKAWLIVTAGNLCKNHLKHWWSKRSPVEDWNLPVFMEEEDTREVMDALWEIPEKYRITLYLHYFEGYKSKEIAEMLGISHSTVRTHLERGREALKNKLGGGFIDGK